MLLLPNGLKHPAKTKCFSKAGNGAEVLKLRTAPSTNRKNSMPV